MAQRISEYQRVPLDLYQTPEWVVRDCLAPFVHLRGRTVWEPAAGEGKMVRALEAEGAHVVATDTKDYALPRHTYRGPFDFTVGGPCPWVNSFDLLVTNPPYGPRGKTATKFIQRGLERLRPGCTMALLLPVDFDSAKGRSAFFGECLSYAAKIVLRKRIAWFEPDSGKKSSPSVNHAFFIWSTPVFRRVSNPPITFYAPLERAA